MEQAAAQQAPPSPPQPSPAPTPPPAEELLRKIVELEAEHAHLKQEMSKLVLAGESSSSSSSSYSAYVSRPSSSGVHGRSHSVSPKRSRFPSSAAARRKEQSGVSWKTGAASFRHASPLQRESRDQSTSSGAGTSGVVGGGPPSMNFTDRQYLNILQSMGQSVHILDLDNRVIYWNRSAERLYGYSAAEALGVSVFELLCDPCDYGVADNIIGRVRKGESWTGQFPVKNKKGERFMVLVTDTPFYDDDGSLVGLICVSSDSRPFQEIMTGSSTSKQSQADSGFNRLKSATTSKLGLDPQQPLQAAITLKISNLASKVSSRVSNKVRSKIRTGDTNIDREFESEEGHHSDHGLCDADHREDANSSGASTPRGDVMASPFGVFSQGATDENSPGKFSRDSGDENEGKTALHKIITSKAEAWMGKKGLSWPWKGNEQDGPETKTTRFGWPWLHNDQVSDSVTQRNSYATAKHESQGEESHRPVNNEPSGSWSSLLNVNSTSSASSCGSTSSSAINKVDIDSDCLDYEILWEDLTIGEQIGQGSCGTVYHALWYGSDVAVKVFSRQEYTEDVIDSFKQEVSLMKRLRHPNILLFMGAVTLPQRLCIVTEFLPRGSLFRLLQRSTSKLDWRRRVHMALDIARGVNYLHHCNPPIIHRDLKSSNLLVDKNWTVKVGDFGLSRLKHETYLTTKTGKGTPQWMAPEVLRNEPSDEKSDVYSYGVILWELATEKIPWENLNSMQVIGAAGFMNQRLEIPKDVDPQWTSLIESCWHSDPQSRPTFQELLERLKDIQRQHTLQLQAARSAAGDNQQKEQ